jgi:hypothetical protein
VSGLARLGASSCGVWTRREALEVLSAGQVDALVRANTWQVPWRGVYADAGHVLDAEQRAWAAVLAAGGAVSGSGGRRLRAVASGRTAARLWRVPLIDDEDPATGADDHRFDDVTVDRNLVRQEHAGRCLVPQRSSLGRDDVVQLSSGLWVTTPGRTLLDCALLLTAQALVCAVDAALHRHLVRRDELRPPPRRPGAALLRSAVSSADARAESPPETLARLLLLPRLPGLEPQVELFDHAARLIARFDLGDREARLAVEADGKAGHAGAAMVAKDRRRDRRTEALGWHTERVTWWELRREPAALVRRVVADAATLQRR